jgi:hypothetical protein
MEIQLQIKEYWRGLKADAREIAAQTESDCGRELNVLTSAFNLYSEAFARIPASGNGESTVTRLAILSQNLNSFHVMISSAVQGFYIQSLVPLRHVYENWLAFWYLAKFPEEAHRWLDPTWEMRPPKADKMLKKIDHPSKQSQSKLRDFYTELNRFAHTDPAVVLSRLEREGDKILIGVGIRFDGEDFRACAYGFSLWIGNCLDAVSSVVPQTDDWHDHYKAVGEDILALIDDYNRSRDRELSQSNEQDLNAV